MLYFFLKGLIIGFCIAAPVGPIGILCITRTLQSGFLSGWITGLGAATADGVYGAIAGFGLTVASSFLLHQQGWIKLIGGLFLLYLGVKTWRSVPAQHAAKVAGGKTLLSNYASTFFLTISNPMTILSFVAVFAGLGLSAASDTNAQALLLVLGVILGSLAWWLILAGTVAYLFKHKLSLDLLKWINRVSGAILFAFGMVALYMLIN